MTSDRIEKNLRILLLFLYMLYSLCFTKERYNSMYLTIIFLGIIAFITFRLSALRKSESSEEKAFWDREHNANFTPKKDISNLSYITIPLDKFPSNNIDKEDERLQNELRELSERRILNLDNMSNTDLKESFGVGNLNTMEEIGDNYQKLCSLLITRVLSTISNLVSGRNQT